ncbi:MAG: Ribosomal RNA small subunit methyltransferase E [Chlamydiae bacterium]|nr:Ribosomal RNA small subunit methyltransferase E [Chlamydiota bacterium]
MPAYRYYTQETLQQPEITLSGLEHQHLQRVMKQTSGESVELVNGQGSLAKATILVVEKKMTRLVINDVISSPLTYQITLLQALTSPNNLEFIIEKGTELGMTELLLFRAEKSQGFFSEQKLKRLETKMIAALKQSGRLHLPKMKWIEDIKTQDHWPKNAFFGDTNPSAPSLYTSLPTKFTESHVCFCSGPESGFTMNEEKILTNLGFMGISLHSNILRAETAPLSFLSLIHQYLRLQSNAAIVN